MKICENNCVGAARQLETTSEMTLLLPTELTDQIAETAASLGGTLDQAATMLLRSGLDVQSHRQKEIERLANLVIEADNDEDAAAANDQLGEFIFGK
jgi:hypothetical protein